MCRIITKIKEACEASNLDILRDAASYTTVCLKHKISVSFL